MSKLGGRADPVPRHPRPSLPIAVWLYGILGYPIILAITFVAAHWIVDIHVMHDLYVAGWLQFLPVILGFGVYPGIVGLLILRSLRSYRGRPIWKFMSFGFAGLLMLVCISTIVTAHSKYSVTVCSFDMRCKTVEELYHGILRDR
jgi:hypothetical protein